MKRREIRTLKRAAARDQSAKAMLALLERSVRFGHKRLALIRCIQAERMGIRIDPMVLAYCQGIADSLPTETLQEIARQATTVPGAAHSN